MRAATRTLLVLACLALAGCAPLSTASERVEPTVEPVYPQVRTYPEIPVFEDLVYATVDGVPLTLDVCVPRDADRDDPPTEPRAAVLVIHGGSWMRGDKADLVWRSTCQWLATQGYVAASVNYRLAPEYVFPAQLDDVSAAVAWLRDADRVRRFDIDPARIGVFGGSAGGNLAALLGTAGVGDWSSGTRVAAVVDLSGPVDLRHAIAATDPSGDPFEEVQLAYLGCPSLDECPSAADASPVTLVDSSDPPFFVAHSTEEFIPILQANGLVAALRGVGVPVTYVTVEGTLHSAQMLDDAMRERILEFFRSTL